MKVYDMYMDMTCIQGEMITKIMIKDKKKKFHKVKDAKEE